MTLIGGSKITSVVSSQVPLQPGGQQYQAYGLSAFGMNDRISFQLLQKSTGNNLSVNNLEQYIKENLLAFDLRRVLLDIGWENYTVGSISYETWVDNWFSACDSLGVGNVLFVSQLTKVGIGSPWITSLIERDVSAQTFSPDGTPALYVSPDNPDVVRQLERELAMLYSYYGQHLSWIGIGTGSSDLDPYFSSNSSMPVLGYSNTTLANFANSRYFAADVNSTGFDSDGVLDSLWAEFRNFNQSVSLSSGNWQLSVPVSVYGSTATGSALAMRFYLPINESAIQIEWYGSKLGPNASNIVAEVLNDSGGKPSTNAVVSSQIQPAASVARSAGWQGPLTFRGILPKGYYWLYLTSPSTSRSESYQVYVRNYPLDNLFAQSIGNSSSGHFSNAGQSIIWVSDSNGTSLAISPYEQPLVVPRPQQSFIAESSFSFNSIYLFLSDRHYNPTNGTVTIVDSALNKTVATGLLSQALTHGLQNWIPIPLNQEVVTQKGHKYVMTITEPKSGFSWIVALRGLTASPPEAGFQGQSQYWLFRLALVNWGDSHLDFTADVSNGFDAVSPGHPDAISFAVANSSSGQQTLSQVSVFMARTNPSNITYPVAVNMTASIYANDPKATIPTGNPLQSLNLLGSSIRQRGWSNFSGFNLLLQSGHTYWVAFSTNSPRASFPMARLVSPYNFKTLVSLNRGSNWTNPGEGPTELAFVVRFSDGTQLGNFIQDIPVVRVDGTNFFSQPFLESNTTEAIGVFIGPIKGTQNPDNFLSVSINPSDGTGRPSGETLAQGRLFSGNITLNYGLQFVQFASAARLEAGQLYWIVVRGVGGAFAVEPVSYSYQQSGVLSSMVSRDGGYSWTAYNNLTNVLSFRILTSLTPLPSYGIHQLYAGLGKYHDLDPSITPSAGWNSYVQSLEIQRDSNLTNWFRSISNSSFDFYGTGTPSILTSLRPQGFVSLPADPAVSTCQELTSYFLSTLPSEGQQFLTVSNLGLLRNCFSDSTNNILGQLSYMRYPGTHYGLNTSLDVLILGDMPTDNLSRNLLAGYNVTYVDFIPNPDTAVAAVQGKYKAILLDSGSKVGDELLSSLEGYVLRGGVLLYVGALPSWLESFVVHSTVSTATPGESNRTIDFWTKNTVYHQQLIVNSSGGLLIAKGLGLTLVQCRCGRGEVAVLDQSSLNASLQVSDTTIVLSNIVGNIIFPNSASPFWHSTPLGASATLTYSIEGTASGQILVWVSNLSPTEQQLTINLNGSYYHLPSDWKVLELSTLNISVGRGDFVPVRAVVPPMSWIPFYVLPNDASYRGDYSSVAVESDLRYPNQALVTSQSFANESALLVLTLNSSVRSVLLNDLVTLPRVGAISYLLTSPQGWHYDNSTQTLFLKWKSDHTSIIRLGYSLEPSAMPITFPGTRFILLFTVVLTTELVILVYLRTTRKNVKPSPMSP
jgi:hypothetical protein